MGDATGRARYGCPVWLLSFGKLPDLLTPENRFVHMKINQKEDDIKKNLLSSRKGQDVQKNQRFLIKAILENTTALRWNAEDDSAV